MPIYEYRCLKCGSALEILRKANDPALKECPKCGGSLKKIISPPAIQFKGSGWYITDYAQKKKSETESKLEEKPKSEKTVATKKQKKSSDSD